MQPSVSVSHPPLPAAAAADEPTGDGAEKRFVNKKLPSAPSVGTWFDKMKAEHEAQEQAKGHFAGKKSKGGQGAANVARGMQWRPAGQSVVADRMVASGPRVLLS